MWAAIETRLKVCNMFNIDCSNGLEEKYMNEFAECLAAEGMPERYGDWCSGEDDNCGAGNDRGNLCCGKAIRIDENGNNLLGSSFNVCNLNNAMEWIDPTDWESMYSFTCHVVEGAKMLGTSVALFATLYALA